MAELESILGARGWLIQNGEELSLTEQIALFSKARFVVGVHRAELGIFTWMNANAEFVELGSREYWHARA